MRLYVLDRKVKFDYTIKYFNTLDNIFSLNIWRPKGKVVFK